MKQRRLILYIPGLGDHYDGTRASLLWFWRIYGVKARLVPMQWYDGNSYEEKYNKIISAIKAAQHEGYRVSLIGESAGASIAMNVFARTKGLHKIISLCGVNRSTAPVSAYIQSRSPAFKKALHDVTNSQDHVLVKRSKDVLWFTALIDTVVPSKHNVITGVSQQKIPMVGHILGILFCLSIGSFLLIREIKR